MGNGLSSSAPVGLSVGQSQQLRDALATSDPTHLATILQVIEDEGLVWDSPDIQERGQAQVRAFQLLCPGVQIVPPATLQDAYVPFYTAGHNAPGSPTARDSIDLSENEDEDPFAGMPSLIDTTFTQPAPMQPPTATAGQAADPFAGMPPLVTARELEAERERKKAKKAADESQPSAGDASDDDMPPLLPQPQASGSGSANAVNGGSSDDDDGMPPLLPQASAAATTSTTASAPPNPFAGMPSLVPPVASSAVPAADADDGEDSDAMPPLIDVPARVASDRRRSAPKDDDSDSDSDAMPELISSSRSKLPIGPVVKPPSALDAFSFSSSFTPSLLPSASPTTFSLPPLPGPDESPLRRSLASLPLDVLHSIGWFLREPPSRDPHGFLELRHPKLSLIRLSATCKVFYELLRKHMWRYVEIRGDEATKKMLAWLAKKEQAQIAGWVKYVQVSTLCPGHRGLFKPTAEALAAFTNLVHFSWQVHALVPPSISNVLSRSPHLTSLHLWKHAVHSAYLLGRLPLIELRVSRSKHDDQCDELLDPGYMPLTTGTFEENEPVYEMRAKRDLSAYRGLIESNHTTLERLCLEPDFKSLLWMETVFGQLPAGPDYNAIANGTTPPSFSSRLPFLTLPRLKHVHFPLADLTSPSWTHLLETSPSIESMCIEHLPEQQGNELSPGAPEGSLKNLKALHFRGGRDDGQSPPMPLREGFENFLGAGGPDTKVEDLEISYMTPADFAALLVARDFSKLVRLTVSLSGPLTKNMVLILAREAPAIDDLAIRAPKWNMTVPEFSRLLTKFEHLTHLTMDHTCAITAEKHPIPQAADLMMSGVYPEDITARLEKYMNDRKKQWTTVFTRIAQENPKLESLDWQASDEISYNWLIKDAPSQPLEVQARAEAMRSDLPFPPFGRRREVLMDPEGRVEMSPLHPNSLETLLNQVLTNAPGLGGGALLDILGGQPGVQLQPIGAPPNGGGAGGLGALLGGLLPLGGFGFGAGGGNGGGN